MVGETLGPYKILEKIGAGGMGEVYRAEDPKLGREVAIKVLPPEFTSDTERLARFEREAQAVAALSHPNILAIYGFGTDQGITYAVMELLDGETLRQRLATGPVPVRKALEYARHIADGLAAAHDKDIVHRDLKPDNVFVTQDGRIKILDFGLARQSSLTGTSTDTHSPTLADATEAGAILGTVGYMSPEQVKGDPADARSDIFALGLVLHEMLTGERAFQRETGAEIMTAILREDPPDLSSRIDGLSPAVDRLVRHCLEKNPTERFQSARDLAFDLSTLTGFSTTGAVPRIEVESTRKRQWLWWVTAAAVVLLAATNLLTYRISRSSAAPAPTRFQRLTFQRGSMAAARFAPDGQTVIYSASWQGGPLELYSTRLDSPESKSLGLPSATLFSVSSKGELAIGLDPQLNLWARGRLATVPLLGGAPREIAPGVDGADWLPDGSALLISYIDDQGEARLESPPGTVIFGTEGRLTFPRVSPDGRWIAACHNPQSSDTRGQVIVVDWQGQSRVLTDFFPDLRGLDWTPDSKEIWFTAKGESLSSFLRSVDLEGNERTLYRGVGDIQLRDVDAEGRVLLERYNGRWETSAGGPAVGDTRDVSIFEWTLIRDISRDGKLLLLAETGDATGSEYATYLRATDGSPPVRLGIGIAQSLSPDGRWVLSRSADSQRLFLYPTGAGQPKTFEPDGIESFDRSLFLDDERALVNAKFAGEGWRGYVLELATGDFESVTDEGEGVGLPAADGKLFVIFGMEGPRITTLDGQETWVPRGIEPGDQVMRWASDNRSVFVLERTATYPGSITRVDTVTGERRTIGEIEPSDRAGTGLPTSFQINPDGTAWAYSYPRIFSELHLVEGLR